VPRLQVFISPTQIIDIQFPVLTLTKIFYILKDYIVLEITQYFHIINFVKILRGDLRGAPPPSKYDIKNEPKYVNMGSYFKYNSESALSFDAA